MIYAGIDAGSRAIKIVLYDDAADSMVGSAVGDQGTDQVERTQRLYDEVLARNHLDAGGVRSVVATGYARDRIEWADTTITEITCHGAGVAHLLPEVRTVVEIGGQDSKLLRLQAGGTVRDFAMNDRCAAGTGRFLEMVANRFECPLAELGTMARQSTAPCAISSMCVVFAETEIIGLLASGAAKVDIVAGVQAAITARIASMAGRSVTPPVALTGGVAMIGGMDTALAEALGASVQVCPTPQLTGALGAALLASRRAIRSR